MTKQEVGVLVQKYLDANPLGDITFAVLPDGVRQERYSWSVPVRPSRQPQAMYAYYEVLAEVEMQVEEHEHVNILFVPIYEEGPALAA